MGETDGQGGEHGVEFRVNAAMFVRQPGRNGGNERK